MFNEVNEIIFATGEKTNRGLNKEMYIKCNLGNKSVVTLRYEDYIIIFVNQGKDINNSLINKARAQLDANSSLLMAVL